MFYAATRFVFILFPFISDGHIGFTNRLNRLTNGTLESWCLSLYRTKLWLYWSEFHIYSILTERGILCTYRLRSTGNLSSVTQKPLTIWRLYAWCFVHCFISIDDKQTIKLVCKSRVRLFGVLIFFYFDNWYLDPIRQYHSLPATVVGGHFETLSW